MGIDAFVLRFEFEDYPFATQFLASKDFNVHTLKEISRDVGLPVAGGKGELGDRIALLAAEQGQEPAMEKVIQRLVGRSKGWISIKMGNVRTFPDLANPNELLLRPGEEQWYGPVLCPDDCVPARWYIRPVFIDHWEVPEDDTGPARKFQIRWLCFARVERDVISLHWRGFSFADTSSTARRHNSQFPYWEHIPDLFEEIEDLTRASVEYVNLHDLILHMLWEQYRDNLSYSWTDRRIRAESSGVSLNAHAGAIYDIDAGGILHLASTIRKSVQEELETKYQTGLPEPVRFDEVILRTLIREYGTLSYEFSLEQDSEVVFRAHSYFGLRQCAKSKSRDSFPNINLHTNKCHDLKQIDFLLTHLRDGSKRYESDKPETLPLFQQR